MKQTSVIIIYQFYDNNAESAHQQKVQTETDSLLTIVSHPAGMNAPSADFNPCNQITPNQQTDHIVHESIFL